ncbi:MAG TPA: transcriptional regulator NrdR [Burkholderiales bacterium]|nr:transcriptional regulator NrdR [Burkholderiales bacterium]
MKCPFCGAQDTQVVDSRVNEEGTSVRRRRRCISCTKRFTTYETVELRMPQIIKQNGNRTEFDRNRLHTGFMRALHKRPVAAKRVDEAIDRIMQKLLSLGEREVPSRHIGEMVMKELYKMDKVAYIRFASVYRSFQDEEDFRDAIKEVQRTAKSRPRRRD